MSKLYVNEIHSKTGAKKAFDVTDKGIITQTNPVSFCALLPSDQNFSNGTYDVVHSTIGTSAGTWDTHNGWNDSEYAYTIPAGLDGYWLFIAAVESSVAGTANILVISKTLDDYIAAGNSAVNWLARGYNTQSSTSTANNGQFIQVIAYMQAGEKVKSEYYQNYGSSQNIKPSTAYLRTGIQGWRLG